MLIRPDEALHTAPTSAPAAPSAASTSAASTSAASTSAASTSAAPTSPASSRPLSLRKKLLFTLITTMMFLGFLELLFRSASDLWLVYHLAFDVPSHSEIGIGVLGDSVPSGFPNDWSQAYPNRMREMFQARGVSSVTVVNLARPGNTSLEVWSSLDRLEELFQKSNSGILLLQVGHNDFPEFWSQFGIEYRGEAPTGFHPPESHIWERYRLVKVIRLGLRTLSEDPFPRTLRPEQREAYLHVVQYVQDWSQHRGVQLHLLTYLVPGDVKDIENAGSFVKNTTIVRRFQTDMNRLIRQVAAQVGCGLIDLEALIPVPPHWDSAWFHDSIHPTARLNERIARVVTDELISSGSLGTRAVKQNKQP